MVDKTGRGAVENTRTSYILTIDPGADSGAVLNDIRSLGLTFTVYFPEFRVGTLLLTPQQPEKLRKLPGVRAVEPEGRKFSV